MTKKSCAWTLSIIDQSSVFVPKIGLKKSKKWSPSEFCLFRFNDLKFIPNGNMAQISVVFFRIIFESST